jgi:hypothetical protein
VSVASTHFSDWTKVAGLNLLPKSRTIRPKASVSLQVLVCYVPNDSSGLVALGYKCDSGGDGEAQQGLQAAGDWSVNGRPGGGSFGTVSGDASTGLYTAPTFEPSPKHRRRQRDRARRQRAQDLASCPTSPSWARIRGPERPVSGIARIQAEVQVTWVLLVRQDNVAQYVSTGWAPSPATRASASTRQPAASWAQRVPGGGLQYQSAHLQGNRRHRRLECDADLYHQQWRRNHRGPGGPGPFSAAPRRVARSAAGTVRVPLVPDEPMVIEGNRHGWHGRRFHLALHPQIRRPGGSPRAGGLGDPSSRSVDSPLGICHNRGCAF